MFAPEDAAERGGVVAGVVVLAIHFGLERVGVLHDDGEFRVVEAELGLGIVSDLLCD